MWSGHIATQFLSLATISLAAWPCKSPLIVTTPPQTVEPYVNEHLGGFRITALGFVFRVLVSANSSAGAFSFISVPCPITTPLAGHNNAPISDSSSEFNFHRELEDHTDARNIAPATVAEAEVLKVAREQNIQGFYELSGAISDQLNFVEKYYSQWSNLRSQI